MSQRDPAVLAAEAVVHVAAANEVLDDYVGCLRETAGEELVSREVLVLVMARQFLEVAENFQLALALAAAVDRIERLERGSGG